MYNSALLLQDLCVMVCGLGSTQLALTRRREWELKSSPYFTHQAMNLGS